MTNSTIKALLGSTLWFSLGISVIAQSSLATSGELKSFADSLRSYGITVTQSSLIAALRNSNPDVRSLAALKLAEDEDSQAIPSIENALLIEKNPTTSIEIASALTGLGDPLGIKHLERMCADTSLPLSITVNVAQHLSMEKSSGACVGILLDALDHTSDAETRLEVLPLLPALYRDTQKSPASPVGNRIVVAAQNLLDDKMPAVRLTASHALAEIGLPSSAEYIRSAISREGDPSIRASLQNDLIILAKRQ